MYNRYKEVIFMNTQGTSSFIRSLTLLIAVLALAVYIFTSCRGDSVKDYIEDKGVSLSQLPPELVEMLRKNPETEDFVLSYPEERDAVHEIDLSEYENTETVPLLLQWDKRWGYEEYGDGMIAFTGCAPTCLSMAAIYLTGDTALDPLFIASKAQTEGYYVEGVGSDWSIMTAFAAELGLDAKELPLDKNTVIRCLENGEPVICAMGPGDFTETGHFILLSAVSEGKIKINDPNSISNSKKLWDFEDISGQIKNLWRYR